MNEIKKIIKTIFEDNADGVTFMPSMNEGNLDIRGFLYNKKSKYEVHNLGHYYHIMIYKANNFGEITHNDNFISILTDPHVYVSHLIDCGFYGVVVKKTKSSKKFINDLYKKILSFSSYE